MSKVRITKVTFGTPTFVVLAGILVVATLMPKAQTWPPIRLLQIAGVLACVPDGVLTIANRFRSPAAPANLADVIFRVDLPFSFVVASDAVTFLLIAGTFWYLAQERHMIRASRRATGVLVFQTLTSLFMSPGMNYIGSTQAGFLFSQRVGLIWVAVQSIVGIWISLSYPAMAAWLLPPYIKGVSGLTLWLAIASIAVVYHSLAFTVGYLAASGVRQRLELSRKNAELEATQQIESDAARLAERLSIARDLHDELGHHLTALSLHLQLASKQTEGAAKRTVDAAYLLARTVLSDIRSTVTDLRASGMIELPKALATLVAGVSRPAIHLKIVGDLDQVDPLPSHALFRSTQEIITNAIRHSAADNLWIELEESPMTYRLQAHDDGRGAQPLVLGNGLRGLRERIENLGGEVSLSSARGFKIDVTLPRKGTGLV